MTVFNFGAVVCRHSKCAVKGMLESFGVPSTPKSVRRRRHRELSAIMCDQTIASSPKQKTGAVKTINFIEANKLAVSKYRTKLPVSASCRVDPLISEPSTSSEDITPKNNDGMKQRVLKKINLQRKNAKLNSTERASSTLGLTSSNDLETKNVVTHHAKVPSNCLAPAPRLADMSSWNKQFSSSSTARRLVYESCRTSVGSVESASTQKASRSLPSAYKVYSSSRPASVPSGQSLSGATSPQPVLRVRSSSLSHRSNGKGSAGSSPMSHRSSTSRVSAEEEFSVRLDKASYQNMFHDIVSIKSMLLKLNRVLSESESGVAACPEEDTSMDLKKQVVFLQQQLLQREAALESLRNEVNRGNDRRSVSETRPSCNAATQTDRVRPPSTGPSLLQNLPSDSNHVVSNRSPQKSPESLDDNARLSLIRTSPSEKNPESNNRQAVLRSSPAEKNLEVNNRQAVVRTAPADKILEKVKKLSFKPVDVLEKERKDCRALNGSGKNVFKITKIDLVLKSDNYGQTDLRLS